MDDDQAASASEPTIRLDQFLKYAEVVQSGGEAKHLVQNGQVSVNGHIESRRGRQLHRGDIVEYDGDLFPVEFER